MLKLDYTNKVLNGVEVKEYLEYNNELGLVLLLLFPTPTPVAFPSTFLVPSLLELVDFRPIVPFLVMTNIYNHLLIIFHKIIYFTIKNQ